MVVCGATGPVCTGREGWGITVRAASPAGMRMTAAPTLRSEVM